MSLNLKEEIDAMINERNMDEEQVLSLIEDMIKSAYRRKFGTDENVKIVFEDDKRTMRVIQSKKVVEEENWYSEHTEIPLDDAEALLGEGNVKVGDIVEIELDPKTFETSSVQSAKQRGQQIVKEYYNDKVYADAKRKEGKLIYGEITHERDDGGYSVNLNMEIEAIFPPRAQSPRETYSVQQKYKFLVERVEKADSPNEKAEEGRRRGRGQRGVRIYLTRASKDFIKALIENEVPEIGNGDVEIKAIVRQAGVRTKIAVDSKKTDIDPVGAVVGAKGSRIQTVKNECEGEMIDVVRYSSDPLEFIANALIPAQIEKVVIIDLDSKHVVAVVDDNQLGLAIGQQGVNVKLAKAITDWNIEVKTPEQFDQMSEIRKIYTEAEGLFNDEESVSEESVPAAAAVASVEEEAMNEKPEETYEEELSEDEMSIDELNLSPELTKKLKSVGINSVQKFFDLDEESLLKKGISEEEIKEVNDSVEIEEENEFECPACHQMVPEGSTVCPYCGAEFEFE